MPLFVRHTVGARSYYQPLHTVARQRLVVERFNPFHRRISPGVRLEIDKIPHIGVLAGKKLATAGNLFGDTCAVAAIRRGKCRIVAIYAPAESFAAVAVGAGKPGIDRNLLHLEAGKPLAEEQPHIVERKQSHKNGECQILEQRDIR